MEFKTVEIKNFRNFEKIIIDISNRNLLIGLNDVGKTNFMYALRFLFDREVRKNGFLDSDFHKKDTTSPIEITIKVDIKNVENEDTQKLRAGLKGAILSSSEYAYIKLTAVFDENELIANPELFWGADLKNLSPMKLRGYFYEIDYIFNTIYIDSYVDMNKLFKKNIGKLIKSNDEADKDTIESIKKDVKELNDKISRLSGVIDFEKKITPEYRKYRDDKVDISVKSELAIKGLYSNIVPYIKQEEGEELYPTSGEGRKKLLAYSIYEIIAEETSKRNINIFLVEEPENHLHKSMQIALSKILFNNNKINYLFVSTHSPYILYEMDNVNIIRIYNETKIDSISEFYKVPIAFNDNKKLLNKDLSEAIFSDRVLLVEGPSERVLFERILTSINPNYESNGIYILVVNGIGFTPYIQILNGLNIKTIVKTDNDLRKIINKNEYSVLGFMRINKYVKTEHALPNDSISKNSIDAKINLYDRNKEKLDEIRKEYSVYLSKSDLENDLHETLSSFNSNSIDLNTMVEILYESKLYNMVCLTEKLSEDDCKKIYEHYNFACLKELIQ